MLASGGVIAVHSCCIRLMVYRDLLLSALA